MADRWIVLEDSIRTGKRYVAIEDTLLKKKYSNYFPLVVSDVEVINRFKSHVKESRAELNRSKSNLNLTNFEVLL